MENLKRLLLIVVVVSITVCSSTAQLKFLKTISKNKTLFIGPGISSIYDNPNYSENGVTKIGFSLGIGATYLSRGHFELQPRLLYEKKGYKTSEFVNAGSGSGDVKHNISNNYITITLLPEYKFWQHRINIGIGPFYGVLVKSQTFNHWLSSSGPQPAIYENTIKVYQRSDYGLTSNIGFKFKAFNQPFTIQANYNYSMYDNFKNSKYPGFSPNKNISTTLLLGIAL